MPEISVEQLAEWRASGRHFILLDVRESFELAVASLSDAVHIPMREIPARINELKPDADIAVLCHHGGRSERVVRFLHARGFENAHDVEGGIEAYALRVDQTIPRY